MFSHKKKILKNLFWGKSLPRISFLIFLIILASFSSVHGADISSSVGTDIDAAANLTADANNAPGNKSGSIWPDTLYARYAAVIDAANGRVLFEKDGYTPAPNASTTKILTCILALEYGASDDVLTVSRYAASMPDVQLNITTGEQYYLRDLLYSLMLQSHNDSAVAIAENIAALYLCTGNESAQALAATPADKRSMEDSKTLVQLFANEMNRKAASLGCTSSYFITPNGLDATDDLGTHSTTAVDLAHIMAYCITNPEFLQITQSSSHQFTSISGKSTRGVHNTNAFLSMMDGVLSGKTGFTGNAGYCYVCAIERDNRRFIAVVLACGWPNNKTYKWKDTRALLTSAVNHYFLENVFSPVEQFQDIPVQNGIEPQIQTKINAAAQLLLSTDDRINITYDYPSSIEAPVHQNDIIGYANIYVNDTLYQALPIQSCSDVERIDFFYCISQIIHEYLF